MCAPDQDEQPRTPASPPPSRPPTRKQATLVKQLLRAVKRCSVIAAVALATLSLQPATQRARELLVVLHHQDPHPDTIAAAG